jgi:hypothetical protein
LNPADTHVLGTSVAGLNTAVVAVLQTTAEIQRQIIIPFGAFVIARCLSLQVDRLAETLVMFVLLASHGAGYIYEPSK